MDITVDDGDWEVRATAAEDRASTETRERYPVMFRCGGYHRWLTREDAEQIYRELGSALDRYVRSTQKGLRDALEGEEGGGSAGPESQA